MQDRSPSPVVRPPHRLRIRVTERLTRVAFGKPEANLFEGWRHVPYIQTRTPGLLITAALDNFGGHFEINKLCCITHAPSGRRVGNPYTDVEVARKIAAALGGLGSWTISDPIEQGRAIDSASKCDARLQAWLRDIADRVPKMEGAA